MPIAGTGGTVLAVRASPGTSGTDSPPVHADPPHGRVGVARVALVGGRDRHDEGVARLDRRDHPGQRDGDRRGDPSAGTATRSGATELPSSVRVPSWATSAVPTNSTASAGAGWPGTRATVSCTRGAPATVSGAATGAVGNCAVWPGIAPRDRREPPGRPRRARRRGRAAT